MADVSDFGAGRLRSGRSRAQLFLVGALALAVVFITLAVLLNTAIYTENLATRSDGVGATDLIEYQGAAHEHASTTLGSVNYRNNTTYAALEGNYSDSVNNWSDLVSTHKAAHSHVAATTLQGTTRGTRIVQDTNRSFTDQNSATDWNLSTDTSVRDFRMSVDNSSLQSSGVGGLLSDDPFTVHITDGDDDTYRVYVYSTLSGVEVSVTDPAGNTEACSTGVDRARVDITNASVAGDRCAPLAFFGDLDGDYDIRYSHADQVDGTYTLVVDDPIGDVDASHYADDDAGSSPYITPALYAADFRLTYRTPEAYYETDLRVAPGEPDA